MEHAWQQTHVKIMAFMIYHRNHSFHSPGLHILLSWLLSNRITLGCRHHEHDTTKQNAELVVSDLQQCQALQAAAP